MVILTIKSKMLLNVFEKKIDKEVGRKEEVRLSNEPLKQ